MKQGEEVEKVLELYWTSSNKKWEKEGKNDLFFLFLAYQRTKHITCTDACLLMATDQLRVCLSQGGLLGSAIFYNRKPAWSWPPLKWCWGWRKWASSGCLDNTFSWTVGYCRWTWTVSPMIWWRDRDQVSVMHTETCSPPPRLLQLW